MIPLNRIVIQPLVLGILACQAASVQPEATPLQKAPITLPESVTLPATMSFQAWSGTANGVPTVLVSIDESRTERAAIATGLNANVVSTEAAQRLKLAPVTGRVKIDVLDTTAAAGQAEIQRLRAATLDLPKLAFAVADVPGLLSPHPHPDAPAAWLGTPFLSAFQVTLDSQAHRITLKPASAALPRVRDASVVPLKMRDNRPYIQVSIPGVKPFLALLDTTSPGTVIPTDVGEKLKLKPVQVETISWREGKPCKATRVELPKLAVGKAEWKSARVFYLSADNSKGFDRSFAVIGMDFISQFNLTIDFAHAKLALAPPQKTPSPTEP